ncbi:GNAT family N-acetyltransferase [Agromyces sp. MMS24-JH15]|uniref:GNAT family N-acetyltransferase n=1 Tax=Agromyces sp. MMS24-JH15 TaxID=3243765 RepID=UPI00374A6700
MVAVRPVRESDLTELVRLIRAHARYERAAPLRPDLETALAATLFLPEPRIRVLVADDDSVLLGYASWSLEASTWRAAEYAHLDCLYLRGSARGRGIGRALMRAVEDAARRAGAAELQWQTPDWNDDAIRFYRRTDAHAAAKVRFALPLPAHRATTRFGVGADQAV